VSVCGVNRRKERVCNECISDIQNATTTSSGESDSGEDGDGASDCDNVTITSRDHVAACYDGDSTLTENDEVPRSVQAPKEVSSPSVHGSGSWSVRDSARTAVSWVTGVVSRSLSSSAVVSATDCSDVVTPQELSNDALVIDTGSLHALHSNQTTCDYRELDEDASSSIGDALPTSSDRKTNRNVLNQELPTATENSELLPQVSVGNFQESNRLQTSVIGTGTEVAIDKPQSSETINVRYVCISNNFWSGVIIMLIASNQFV